MAYKKEYKYSSEAMEIVAKIRELRMKRGWTVQELAYRSDLERASISRIENGRFNLSIETLYKIADALEISPKTLLPR